MILPRDLYGVTGWPLGQTLSPLLHNTGFQSLSIPSVYMAWPIRPEALPDFTAAVRTLPIKGCSVTIPHKIAIMTLADEIGNSARMAGAANTLFWQEGQLCCENTDVTGFLAPLADINLEKMDALLLGAGGAAHAVAAGLIATKCGSVTVTSPHDQSQYSFCDRFGFLPIPWRERYDRAYDLVINSTPLGMKGKFAAANPYDFSRAPRGIAYDLVYNPLMTLFLESAAKNGCKCINGLEMFFYQGNAQFRIWTGRDLPAASRVALEQALGASE